MEENESKIYSKVPAKVSPWSNFKSFWLQEVNVELTPYQSKVFGEVRDFWNQEIYFDKGFHVRPAAKDELEVSIDENESDIKISL